MNETIHTDEKTDIARIRIDRWTNAVFEDREVQADILRLDLIHPVISGNKWFKLKYSLSDALAQQKKGLISFGGAWSNHLVAMACACRQYGLKSTGIIRGEEPAVFNPTLRQMKAYGMDLVFVSRAGYRDKEAILKTALDRYPQYYYVPEGGQGDKGIAGAAEILSLAPLEQYTHITCAVGTGTTFAGIINAAGKQQCIGVCCLKIPLSEQASENAPGNELNRYIQSHAGSRRYHLYFDYHFGGYARHTPALLAFMNEVYLTNGIPTDIVYTGKLLYAIINLAQKDHFQKGDRILVIHSGGLLGNRSLSEGALCF
ncbi:MAG: pyridoxal-phosphate dependent enzyme [Chitinophagaceae bacterium]|nr:pyridoxal-phosphate dependent enzyme [Chitinophagaceae bacterium]